MKKMDGIFFLPSKEINLLFKIRTVRNFECIDIKLIPKRYLDTRYLQRQESQSQSAQLSYECLMTGEEGNMSNQGPLKISTEHCIQSHFLKLKLMSFSSHFSFWLTKVTYKKRKCYIIVFFLLFFIFVLPVLPCKRKHHTNHTTYFRFW